MTLTEKESYFNKAILDRFISDEGLFYGSLEHGKCSTYDDQCYVSGLAAAAYCMKYAHYTTQKEGTFNDSYVAEAYETAIKLIRGLFLLQDVTGIKGLVARGIRKAQPISKGWNPSHIFCYEWLGDVSTDQLISMVMGYSVAYELIDDEEIKNGIRNRICAIADHLIDNDMQIIDLDGKQTKHGNLRKRWGFNPLNCFVGLAVFSLAKRVHWYTGEHDKYVNYYSYLISQGYSTQAKRAQSAWWDWIVKWLGKTNHSDNAMFFIAALSIHFSDPEAPFLQSAVENCWKLVKDNQVPFFDFVTEKICYQSGPIPVWDPQNKKYIIDRSTEKEYFQNYPLDLHPKKIPAEVREKYKKWWINGHGGVPQSRYVVPIQDRFLDVCDFKENSRRLAEGWDQPHREVSSLSWMFQFWLGKYFDFI